MPVNGKSRRSYRGAPVSNTLGVTLAEAATNITLAIAMSGWSTDAEPFFVVVDPGTAKEEKICVKYASATTLTVVNPADTSTWSASATGRGADGTTDRQHEQGAVIYPVFTALEANQANELVSKYANAGSVVYQGSGTPGTFTELAIGTASHVLRVNSGIPQWGQITADGIGTGAITSEKILDNTIVLGDLAVALQRFLVPVGSINAYAGVAAPAGWLLCNGDAFSSATYPTLYSVLGNVATTPNLVGKFPMGKTASSTGSTLLGSGGSNTIAETNLPSHTHTINHDHTSQSAPGIQSADHAHAQKVGLITYADGALSAVVTAPIGGSSGPDPNYKTGGVDANHSHTVDIDAFTGNSGPTGSGTAYFQPFVAVNYIIKHD